MLQQVDAETVPILGVLDVHVVKRLREVHENKVANPKGRPRQWGKRLPAPQGLEKWNTTWQQGSGYIALR